MSVKKTKKTVKSVPKKAGITKKISSMKSTKKIITAAPKKAVPAKKVTSIKKTMKAAPKKVTVVKKVAVAKKTVKAAKVVKKPAVPVKKISAVKKTVKATKVLAKKTVPAKKIIAKKKVVTPVKPLAKKPVPAKKIAEKTNIIKTVAEKPAPVKKIVSQKPAEKVVAAAPKMIDLTEKIRYSDKELQEFKIIILNKLEDAKRDLALLTEAYTTKNENDTNDTSPTFKVLEEGSNVLSKEENSQLASRQQKFIRDLENALLRIENKTYGICRITGKLIPKERLRVVPHATMSIEAKLSSQKQAK